MENTKAVYLNREVRLNHWLETYAEPLLQTCLYMLPDRAQAEDAVQDGDCDYVVLESNSLRLTCVAPEEFSFNASHYTEEELTHKAHNFELEKSGSTVLCLDYRQNGIGSNSCGPVLIEKYRLVDETIDFTIRIMPETK